MEGEVDVGGAVVAADGDVFAPGEEKVGDGFRFVIGPASGG